MISIFFLNLFIYFWLRWVLVAVRGLSLAVASGGTLCCSAWASHYGGFFCCGAQALGARASAAVARGALEHRLSSCGARA